MRFSGERRRLERMVRWKEVAAVTSMKRGKRLLKSRVCFRVARSGILVVVPGEGTWRGFELCGGGEGGRKEEGFVCCGGGGLGGGKGLFISSLLTRGPAQLK